MKISTILKRCGIVSHREIQQVVAVAKKQFGKLSPSHCRWDGNRLDKEARKLLRMRDASEASDRLGAAISASPSAYIQGWESLCESVDTCCQMVRDRLGKMPEAQMSLRVERMKIDVVELLEKMSVAEAANQLIAHIQKRPGFYINGFSAMLANRHISLVVEVCDRDIGGDWEVNVDLVKARLQELFDEEETSENAIKRILLDISNADNGYLRPKIDLAKQMAENAVSQLKPNLQAGLPAGAYLREDALKATILRLLMSGTPMKRLVEELLAEVKKAPFDYITRPPTQHEAVDYAQSCY